MKNWIQIPLMLAIFAASLSLIRSPLDAARPASVTCTLDMVFELRQQDGTLVSTQPYQKTFVLTEGVPFEDDFSTATRFKFMTANLERIGGETIVSVNWFSDVSVSNSTDFNATLVMANNQKQGRTSASNTYSTSSIFPNSGHATTSCTLQAIRN